MGDVADVKDKIAEVKAKLKEAEGGGRPVEYIVALTNQFTALINQLNLLQEKENKLIGSSSQGDINELKRMIAPVVMIVPIVCNMAIESNNLWTNTQQTDAITEVDEEQKDRFLEHLGYDVQYHQSVKRKRLTCTCMVTNEDGDSDYQVVMAHIAPKRSKIRLLNSIGMNERDLQDVRNCLLLAHGIEKGFDKLRLSFIKSNPLKNRLYMKIWDDSIRSESIFEGSSRTIGEFDGARLKLGEASGDTFTHNPFRRALSYQAYIAYLRFKHIEGNIEPAEFGSDEETNYAVQCRLMKQSVIQSVEEELESES